MRENETPHKILIQKANQIQDTAALLFDKTKDWQMIKQFMCNRHSNIKLSDVQQKKLDRYQFIYNQLSSGRYTEQDVISQLIKLKDKVSLKQAYEDIFCTKELFNTAVNINKQFEIKNELNIAKDARRKCVEIGDFKNAGVISKVIVELLKLVPDEENISGELFEGHQIEAVFDPRLLGAPDINMKDVLDAINAKRKVKINTDFIDNLEFEEKVNEKTTAL